MTSDAKIGLLLGLVFIFIIAFVINGLPRFRSTTNGSELTTNMVSSQNDTLGIGDREREVQDMIDWPEPPVEEPQAVTETIPEIVSTPLEDDEDVRFQIKLPETISYEPIVEIPEDPEPDPIVPIEPPQVESSQSTLAKLFDPPAPEPPKPEPPKEQKKEEKIEFKKPPRSIRRNRPVSPKVYVVSDGDNLAKIAQKFYGPEDGNTRANIMRIFEFNKGQLASPHDLKIGQKLIIPPLVVSQAALKKTESASSGSIFEKVESIGRKILQPEKPKSTHRQSIAPIGGKQYVVKEGDSLWKIASEKLGNGSRYKEILTLNADILADEHSLSLGTTLKLPAK